MIYFFAVMLCLQLAYWATLAAGFRRPSGMPRNGGSPPSISVIVAARDEEAALPRLLEHLHAQSHPDFEIVLVDDGSVDRTAQIMQDFGRRCERARVVRLPHAAGKKHALSAGIDAAAHELLAFTDADCEPRPDWLAVLARTHASTADDTVLIGYSPFRASGNSLVERLACYETFVTGFLTAAAAGLGHPYMAVGRNLSYPRSVYRRVDGFSEIMHSLSGDDDLFVQAVTRRRAASVRALLDPRSFVPTAAPRTWRAWLRQKHRHASAGRYYRGPAQAHLAAFHGSALAVWLAPFFLGWMGALMLVLRMAVQITALSHGALHLGERRLLGFQPLLEPLYVLYNTLFAPAALLIVPRRW